MKKRSKKKAKKIKLKQKKLKEKIKKKTFEQPKEKVEDNRSSRLTVVDPWEIKSVVGGGKASLFGGHSAEVNQNILALQKMFSEDYSESWKNKMNASKKDKFLNILCYPYLQIDKLIEWRLDKIVELKKEKGKQRRVEFLKQIEEDVLNK